MHTQYFILFQFEYKSLLHISSHLRPTAIKVIKCYENISNLCHARTAASRHLPLKSPLNLRFVLMNIKFGLKKKPLPSQNIDSFINALQF